MLLAFGLFAGWAMGFLTACLCVAARRGDENLELAHHKAHGCKFNLDKR